MMFVFDTVVNRPVGKGKIVSGRVTQPCIAIAREGNVFSCKVSLGDGASTTFKTLHAVREGTEVTFNRKTRRFGSYRYELDDIHDMAGARHAQR